MHNDHEFCGPLNMGNPGEFTILELAQQVIEMTGSSSTISFEQLPTDNPNKENLIDIRLAKERYGWEPQVRLHEGLELTIEYLKNML